MDKELLSKLGMALDEMAGRIAELRDMIPGDAAEEQSENIDSATEEQDEQESDGAQVRASDDKEQRKAAAVQMLKRNLPAGA